MAYDNIAATHFSTDSALERAKILEQKQDYRGALSVYSDIINLDSSDTDSSNKNSHENNVILAAILARGLLFKKIAKYQNSLRDFHSLLGMESIDSIKYIILYHIADILKLLRRYDDAISYFIKAIKSKHDEVFLYYVACDLMMRNNQADAAMNLVELGLKSLPYNPDFFAIKAKIYTNQRDYEKAEDIYKKALVNIDKVLNKNHFMIEYAQIKGKLKKYDESFKIISEAKNEQKSKFDNDVISTETIDNLIEQSQKINITQDWNANVKNDSKSPIFLAGFPRSGTTLMEQVLFSHPHLFVTDEMNILPNMVSNMAKIFKQNIQYPDDFNYITKDRILNWKNEYYARVAYYSKDFNRNQRVVDKNPISFLYMLTIKRFFPQSPIIMMIRDPRDVVLSCFFQNFTPNPSNSHFYSLKDTAQYYADSMGLYLKFKNELNMNILEVKYENLCDDFEGNIRKVISYINEDWNDNLLEYYKQDQRYIQTPSFSDVTKKISKNAIGNWKNYKKHIECILPILEPFIDEFGYKK